MDVDAVKCSDTMIYNYSSIIASLPFPISLYEELEFIHFQTTDLKEGSLLIEERNDKVILWNNDLNLSEYSSLYRKIRKELPVPIFIVYIDTEKEYTAVLQNEGKQTDFSEEDYPSKFGSFILK